MVLTARGPPTKHGYALLLFAANTELPGPRIRERETPRVTNYGCSVQFGGWIHEKSNVITVIAFIQQVMHKVPSSLVTIWKLEG